VFLPMSVCGQQILIYKYLLKICNCGGRWMRQRQAENPPIEEEGKSVKCIVQSSVFSRLSLNKVLLSRVVILVTPRE
jgi:hypothetical protein